MLDVIIILISACLSSLLFGFLFYKLNYSTLSPFEAIQSKIDNLNDEKKRKLRVITYILVIIIYAIISNFKISNVVKGFIFGILLQLRDICFRENLVENYFKLKNESKEEEL